MIRLSVQHLELTLEHPFTIARGTINQQTNLLVCLEAEGQTGFGEVMENRYYGHSVDKLTEQLLSLQSMLADFQFDRDDRGWPTELWGRAYQWLDSNMFALSALDIAANDLAARLQNQSQFEYWGLDWDSVPSSSYTIGIDSIEKMIGKMQQYAGWPIYKIKLGTKEDIQIVESLRRNSEAIFRVDANCGWSVQQAIDNSHALAELGVEFIEQPLPPESDESDHRRLFLESALPIIADESCQVESDVAKCKDLFHGVNAKLCKCGGVTPALRMLRQARELGLKTMVGCMIESSIGISAAAHLLPLLDYADLDGAVLLSDDPAQGVCVDQGQVQLADEHGTGASLKH